LSQANEYRVARERKEMSTSELASKVGISRRQVERIEAGSSQPEASTKANLRRVLGLSKPREPYTTPTYPLLWQGSAGEGKASYRTRPIRFTTLLLNGSWIVTAHAGKHQAKVENDDERQAHIQAAEALKPLLDQELDRILTQPSQFLQAVNALRYQYANGATEDMVAVLRERYRDDQLGQLVAALDELREKLIGKSSHLRHLPIDKRRKMWYHSFIR